MLSSPSVTAGKIRWRMRSSKPVSSRKLEVPPTGRDGRPHSWNLTAKRMIARRPTQKVGTEPMAVATT